MNAEVEGVAGLTGVEGAAVPMGEMTGVVLFA